MEFLFSIFVCVCPRFNDRSNRALNDRLAHGLSMVGTLVGRDLEAHQVTAAPLPWVFCSFSQLIKSDCGKTTLEKHGGGSSA